MHERGLQLPKVVGQQHDFLMVAIDTGNFILAYEEDLEEGLGSEYERLWVEDVPLVLASDASVVLRRERFGGILYGFKRGIFLNQEAFDLVRSFVVATRPSLALKQVLKEGGLSEITKGFVEAAGHLILYLIAEGYLRPSQEGLESKALFLDDQHFSDDRYYRPLSMEIELTNRCYRRCAYCAYESGPEPKIPLREELTFDEWGYILDSIRKEGVFYLEFTGGDPLSRPDGLEIIRLADELGFSVQVNTDLSVLRDSDLDKIASTKNLNFVGTTLDGSSPDSHDLLRGKGGFKTTLRQISLIAKAGIPLAVFTVVHKKNYTEIRKIGEIATQNNAMYGIAPMYPAGRGASLNHLVLSQEEWDFAVGEYMDMVRLGAIKPHQRLWYKLSRELRSEKPARDLICLTSRGNRALRVDPRGNVYVSAKLREWRPRYSFFGNLLTSTLADIWENSPLLQELRKIPVQPNFFDAVDIRTIPNYTSEIPLADGSASQHG